MKYTVNGEDVKRPHFSDDVLLFDVVSPQSEFVQSAMKQHEDMLEQLLDHFQVNLEEVKDRVEIYEDKENTRNFLVDGKLAITIYPYVFEGYKATQRVREWYKE